ncbi:hypothetical protein [Bacillus sp. REN10]|uniref:hypothetical protein n=1 Tax=Bacillus sp. REN10 TaxID=2782541 RepID=UPI00193C5649|nr:hypothetical protein [Bacillus sp. REN10]
MKTTTLNFFDSDVQFEIDMQPDSDLITLTVRDMEIDQEKSEPGNTVFVPARTVEVYLSHQEMKELIRTLQGSIPLEELE